MDKSLVIGMGEIGKAIAEVIGDCQTLDIESKEIKLPIDIMHICIPYSPSFEEIVKAYAELYEPKYTVVYSTVPIGTCKRLGVYHSPVEGRHPQLAESIRGSNRFLAPAKGPDPIGRFWGKLTKRVVYMLPDTNWTEFLKLRSTAKYGINLVWSDYENKVATDLGMPFSRLKDFDKAYNETYKDDHRIQRYILDPPDGTIGGHCIVPNAKLLNEQYPNDWLEKIIEMEKKPWL